VSKRLALASLLLLGACHRGKVADVTLDADRAAENATAAKTLADIAAAEDASSTPLPPRSRAEPAAEAPPSESDGDEDAAVDAPVTQGNAETAIPQ
jgi:hypothetical protein